MLSERENSTRISKGISIKLKIFLICLFIAVSPLIILFISSYSTAKEKLLDAGEEKSKEVIQYTMGILTSYDQLVKEGKVSLDEAQEMAKTTILGPMQSDGVRDLSKSIVGATPDVYVYALSKNADALMHPNLEGVSIKGYIAADGQDLGLLLTDETKFNKVVEYLFENEMTGETGIAYDYREYFEPWDWILAYGSSADLIYVQPLKGMIRAYTVVGTITILIALLAAYIFTLGLTSPIKDLSRIIDRLSKYDLTFDENSRALKYLRREDEIGTITRSLATMQNNLITLIKGISNTAQQVASSSEELTATSQQSATAADEVARTIEEIARGAGDQARNTEEGAVHINELGQLIEKDQKCIEDLNSTANEVSTLKDEGLEGLKELVEKTSLSNNAAKDVLDIIINTNESATKIENASQMIKSIAEQTNLLALNAAIEAARAGESGRGFAVVADEIRRLSEQSNSFTEEISDIIQELTGKTRYAVQIMQEASKVVVSQAKSVEESSEKFEGIAAAIEKMKKVIADVNQSGHEMEIKKNQIISIIENLSALSEENAAGTQEASASIEEQTSSVKEIANASESLAKLAEEMQGSISKFMY